MDKQDWFECGERIGELVQSAVDHKDYGQLNEAINDALNDTMNAVTDGLFGNPAGRGRSAGGSSYGEYRAGKTAWQAGKDRARAPYDSMSDGRDEPLRSGMDQWGRRRTPGGMKGMGSMITGYTLAGTFGIITLVFGILSAVIPPLHLPFMVAAVLFGAGTAASVMLGNKGLTTRRLLKRLDRYLTVMGDRDTCTIEELAAGSGRSVKQVKKDLKKMSDLGLFETPAYMDDAETVLMTSHAAYRQYKETMQEASRQARSKQEQEEARRQAEKNMASLSEDTRQILQEGRDFIEHIHACNEQIPDEEMTRKLDVLEDVVTRIFEQVAQHPESAPDLHRMMSYYLPITRKLVDAYIELGSQGYRGENVMRTRSEIEASLDTINAAFGAFLDGFYQDTAWDISSDISALKTMMARDGLTGQGDFSGDRIRTVAQDVTPSGAQAPAAAQAAGAAAAGAAAGAAAARED